MNALCENFMSIAYCIVKLQVIKVKELDVCGSLVLSNLVTYVIVIPWARVLCLMYTHRPEGLYVYTGKARVPMV